MSKQNLLLSLEMEKINHPIDLYNDLPQNKSKSKSLDISSISELKMTNYSYLCKHCYAVPVMQFDIYGIVKYICECPLSPFYLTINEVINEYLYYSPNIDMNKFLNCKNHPDDKYIYYCTRHKINLCPNCLDKCIDHGGEIEKLILDEKTLNKSKYLESKNEDEEIFNNKDNDSEDDIFYLPDINKLKYNNPKKIKIDINNNENDIKNDNKNDINNNKIDKINAEENQYNILDGEEENELINIMKYLYNKDDYVEYIFDYKNLNKIILYNNHNFSHHNLSETISNFEKYIVYLYGDCNIIKLNYKITEENIQDNSIKLFGKEYVNNNKENCFLIINEKIMDLSHSIKLTDILDNISNNIPNEIDVYLIERKSKVMTDLSCMFKNISTITNKSDFFYDNYDSSNVISLSKMFYNCKSLEYLPDISKLKTKNVKDMSHMFYNCSSLKEFPDISLWNTENVIYMNSMFENCNTIASLPNISGWNIINTRFMNYMFKNCTSIPNLREALNWNINEEAFTFGMFEGIRLLEDEEILQNVNNCILTRLKNFMKMIYQYIKRIGLFNFIINILFYFFIIILINLISISSPFFSTYFSFNFNNIKEYIHFPTKYIEPSNYINLEYIASFNNITNITIIRENEKNYIDNLLNFTNINEGKTFEYHQGMNKFLNIIILIIFIFNIINFLYILIKGRFFIYTPKYYILISLFFLLALVLIILDILDFIIINKLLNSFYSFKERVDNIYEYKYIYNIILKEKNFFYFSLAALFINIVANFTLLLLGFDIWKIIFINRKSSNNQRNPLKSYI